MGNTIFSLLHSMDEDTNAACVHNGKFNINEIGGKMNCLNCHVPNAFYTREAHIFIARNRRCAAKFQPGAFNVC